jgi:hypothetical protein
MRRGGFETRPYIRTFRCIDEFLPAGVAIGTNGTSGTFGTALHAAQRIRPGTLNGGLGPLLPIINTDDDDRVGDQPAVVALFIQHLQAAVDHVDVAAAVGKRL